MWGRKGHTPGLYFSGLHNTRGSADLGGRKYYMATHINVKPLKEVRVGVMAVAATGARVRPVAERKGAAASPEAEWALDAVASTELHSATEEGS